MERLIQAKIHNHFDFELRDAESGELKQTARSYNVVLDGYFSLLLATSIDKLSYINLGSGTGTLNEKRNAMFQEKGRFKATTIESVKAYPTSYVKKKIVLTTVQLAGVSITEVGFAGGSNGGNLTTHSLIKDSEGNPIVINKTATDVLTVYATFYFTMGEAVPGQYVLPTAANNIIIDLALDLKAFAGHAIRYGVDNKIEIADDLRFTSIGGTDNTFTSADVENRKLTVYGKLTYPYMNNNIIKSFGSQIIAVWMLPNSELFPNLSLNSMPVGVGDGTTLEFNSPIPQIVKNSEVIRINGVTKIKGVDYEIDYENNAIHIPQLLMGTDPRNSTVSGGSYYDDTYKIYPIFCWGNARSENPLFKRPNLINYNTSPLCYDFGKARKFNTLCIVKDSLINTAGPQHSIAFAIEYSLDGTNWAEIFRTKTLTGNSLEVDMVFDTVIAQFWRLKSLSESMFRSEIVANRPLNICLGYTCPGITFTTPPPDGAAIEMDCQIDCPLKNENWEIETSFSVQFERG